MENLRTLAFTLPSGYSCEIREQNGEDEEILSNPADVKNFMNLNKFIAAIVIKTDFTASGKLLVEDVLNLPLLDRAAIMMNSRIFSLGDELEFTHQWPRSEGSNDSGECTYTQSLNEFIFEDYGNVPTEEELNAKPEAIPYYPREDLTKKVQLKNYEYTLSSGKKIRWDLATAASELYLMKVGFDNITRNKDLLARNLQLEVDGKWEKVQNFRLFSVRDMAEMRKEILSNDPQFTGLTDIEDPITYAKDKIPVMAVPTFFYLTEF